MRTRVKCFAQTHTLFHVVFLNQNCPVWGNIVVCWAVIIHFFERTILERLCFPLWWVCIIRAIHFESLLDGFCTIRAIHFESMNFLFWIIYLCRGRLMWIFPLFLCMYASSYSPFFLKSSGITICLNRLNPNSQPQIVSYDWTATNLTVVTEAWLYEW